MTDLKKWIVVAGTALLASSASWASNSALDQLKAETKRAVDRQVTQAFQADSNEARAQLPQSSQPIIQALDEIEAKKGLCVGPYADTPRIELVEMNAWTTSRNDESSANAEYLILVKFACSHSNAREYTEYYNSVILGRAKASKRDQEKTKIDVSFEAKLTDSIEITGKLR